MRKSDDVQYYERRWLNPERGRAFTICKVRNADGSHYVDAALCIGDCQHMVELEFDFYHDCERTRKMLEVDPYDEWYRSRGAAVEKLDGLIKSLTSLRAAMLEVEYREKEDGEEVDSSQE